MGLDINKPYRTVGGQKAWATSTPEELLVGWTKDAAGIRTARLWYATGEAVYDGDGFDLVNVPEKRTVKVWINVYPSPFYGHWHWSRVSADLDTHPGTKRIACIERDISYTVGEGL